MSTNIRRNAELAQQAGPSDWFVNLHGRTDVPHIVVEAFDRLREDNQRFHRQLQEARSEWANTPVVTAPAPTINTFNELYLGSPATGGTGAVRFRVGRGTPEGVVEGSAFRDIWLRLDAAGATTFMYVKTTGEGKTGWTAAAL